MKQSIGEFLDRISILLHKCQKIGEKSYPEFIKYAEEFLLDLPEENFSEIIKDFRELYKVNGEIWKLEFEIRMFKEDKLGMEECGKRAIKIRDLNNKRLEIQNEVIRKFGGGYTNPNVEYWKREKAKVKREKAKVKRGKISKLLKWMEQKNDN